MVKVIEKNVMSSDKIHMLKGKLYIPEGKAKGFFHVVHGMTEHIARYDGFMKKLAEEGYITFGYDHLGHGMTARSDSELGFIAHENGWEKLVDDVFVYGNAIRKSMGGDLPFILMGHSMGSFIARLTASKYDHYDKLIIMGTAGPNPIAGAGIAVTAVLKKLKGERSISDLVYSMAFGSYNERFKDEDDPYAWLSTTKENRDKYRADKYCTFKFTVSAMQDLIRLNKGCNEKSWFSTLNKSKPVLIVSGAEDPVGEYGKGVTAVYELLKAQGVDVKMKLYPGCRHEILNDTSRDEVISDILAFIA